MTYEEFLAGVQEALTHLYDAAFLQRYAFLSIISEEEEDLRRIHEVRRCLLAAIRALRPSAGVPADAPDWRAYRILHFRYIEGLNPGEAMAKVGLGKSQFFREQARALDLVAQTLWRTVMERRLPPAASAAQDGEGDGPADRQRLAQLEAERLCARAIWQPVAVGAALADVRPLLMALAQVKQVELAFAPAHDFTVLHGDPSLLRQVLLNLISYAFDIGEARLLRITTFADTVGQGIGVAVQRQGQQDHDPAALSHRLGVGLEICRRLMDAMGGRVDIQSAEAGTWRANLVWGSDQPPHLLVVDDNESFHHLCRRYLSGYAWHVSGATSAQAARKLLANHTPEVILLDIMMPNEDGWQLLATLKGNVNTQAIPVIVCSVLNEPELAKMLGAAAYLTKPVTQQALLDALMRGYPDPPNRGPARSRLRPGSE
ncbi:MAG: response regulator [Caldilineaceae bacterium]|nr:response regulator [Caldilineaceae bacterium]